MKKLFLMTVTKRAVLLSVLILLLTFPVMAQRDKGADLFVGYSYMHGFNSYIDTDGHINFDNKNGWHTNINVDLFKYVGIAADVSGHYGSLDQHTFLVGPRLISRGKWVTSFAHYMVGVANLRGRLRDFEIPIDRNSRTSFTEAFGTGLDINISEKFAIRAIQLDVVYNHVVKGQTDMNTRLSAGIVFRFNK